MVGIVTGLSSGDLSQDFDIGFDDLPEEIVVSKVFSLLNATERQRLRPVCLYWKNLIDTFFGQVLHINDVNLDSLISSHHVAYAKFTNWTRDIPIQCPIFTMGLRTLEIYSPVVPISFKKILPLLKSCININSLIIRNVIGVNTKDVEDIDQSLEKWEWLKDQNNVNFEWFPHLETFKFVEDWPSRATGIEDSPNGKNEFLSFILDKMGQTRLNHLDITLTNSLWWLPLSELLSGNLQSIETEQSYNVFMKIPIHLLKERLRHLSSLKISYQNVISIQCQFYPHLSTNGVRQIETFRSFLSKSAYQGKCSPFDYMQGQGIHSLWSDVLLRNQCNIRELNLDLTFDSPEHLVPILENNSKTLQNIRIVTTTQGTQYEEERTLWENFDFHSTSTSAPKKFQKLKHFSFLIDSPNCNQNEEPNYQHPFLRQIFMKKCLPNSLVKLQVTCPLYFDIKDMDGNNSSANVSKAFKSLRQFGNLKQLELCNFGNNTKIVGNCPWFVIRNGEEDCEIVNIITKFHVQSIISNLPKSCLLKLSSQEDLCMAEDECDCPCTVCESSDAKNQISERVLLDSEESLELKEVPTSSIIPSVDPDIFQLNQITCLDQDTQITVQKLILVEYESKTKSGLCITINSV